MDSSFINMTKEELKTFFEELGVEVEFVEEGKGGLFVDGKKISVEDFIDEMKSDFVK